MKAVTNTMKQFTVQQIDDALREVINKTPDFRYSRGGGLPCYYYKSPVGHAACSGCVFGQALQLLGISKEDLRVDGGDGGSINRVEFQFLPPHHRRPAYWGKMQRAQDHGKAWGSLLEFMPSPTPQG